MSSILEKIQGIQASRDIIRSKMVAAGQADSDDKLAVLAENLVLSKNSAVNYSPPQSEGDPIEDKISSIQYSRNIIRAKMIEAGQATSNDKLAVLAANLNIGGSVPSFGDATEAEMVSALASHYAGEIDLTEYWHVGDERTVQISAIPKLAGDSNEPHAAQAVTFVIMNVDNGIDDISNPNYNYQLATPINGKTRPAFIIGMKNGLLEGGYMCKELWGSWGTQYAWLNTYKRDWCEFGFLYYGLSSEFKNMIKEVNVKYAFTYNAQYINTDEEKCFFPAMKEIIGGDARTAGTGTGNSNLAEYQSLSQWEWYKTVANRIKSAGDNGTVGAWWTRSMKYNDMDSFCTINASGAAYYSKITNTVPLLSVAMCL